MINTCMGSQQMTLQSAQLFLNLILQKTFFCEVSGCGTNRSLTINQQDHTEPRIVSRITSTAKARHKHRLVDVLMVKLRSSSGTSDATSRWQIMSPRAFFTSLSLSGERGVSGTIFSWTNDRKKRQWTLNQPNVCKFYDGLGPFVIEHHR